MKCVIILNENLQTKNALEIKAQSMFIFCSIY
jgi:hypothetical protein